jgi:hypothetical protein
MSNSITKKSKIFTLNTGKAQGLVALATLTINKKRYENIRIYKNQETLTILPNPTEGKEVLHHLPQLLSHHKGLTTVSV